MARSNTTRRLTTALLAGVLAIGLEASLAGAKGGDADADSVFSAAPSFGKGANARGGARGSTPAGFFGQLSERNKLRGLRELRELEAFQALDQIGAARPDRLPIGSDADPSTEFAPGIGGEHREPDNPMYRTPANHRAREMERRWEECSADPRACFRNGGNANRDKYNYHPIADMRGGRNSNDPIAAGRNPAMEPTQTVTISDYPGGGEVKTSKVVDDVDGGVSTSVDIKRPDGSRIVILEFRDEDGNIIESLTATKDKDGNTSVTFNNDPKGGSGGGGGVAPDSQPGVDGGSSGRLRTDYQLFLAGRPKRKNGGRLDRFAQPTDPPQSGGVSRGGVPRVGSDAVTNTGDGGFVAGASGGSGRGRPTGQGTGYGPTEQPSCKDPGDPC
jgi:hypothetical protein